MMPPAKLKKGVGLPLTFLILLIFVSVQVFAAIYQPSRAHAFFNFNLGKILGDDDDRDDNKDDDKDDDRDDDEDDDKDDDKDNNDIKRYKVIEVERTIKGPSGDITKIKKKMEDGKEKFEIKSYDASGRKIEERKYESKDDNDRKIEIKSFDVKGNKVSELKYRTNDGEEVRLTVKQQNEAKARLRYDSEHDRLILTRGIEEADSNGVVPEESDKNEVEEEISIEVAENEGKFKIKKNQREANVRFPMNINEAGEVVVVTPNKEVILGAMPDEIVQKAIDKEKVGDIENIEILQNGKTNELEYQITAKKTKKAFGIFKVNIPMLLWYDAGTGEFEKSSQSFVTSLLDRISF